jgi:hypothetical protein
MTGHVMSCAETLGIDISGADAEARRDRMVILGRRRNVEMPDSPSAVLHVPVRRECDYFSLAS